MLYGHGDNGYVYEREIVADFSTNIWYGGEPSGLKEHLFRQWKVVNKYPEVLAESLAGKLGLLHGLSAENMLVTNGATESIYLLAQLYRNKRSCIVIPSFSEYEDACRMHEHQMNFLPWEDLTPAIRLAADRPTQLTAHPALQADPPSPAPDLFWIGNPNNPTGAVFPALEKLLYNNPQTIFAVDEAFIGFTDAIPSAIGAVTRYPNLVIFRSLTKSFAIPGLRLGYIVANREIIQRLQSLKLPWSVNALALTAGNFILDHCPAPHWSLAPLLRDKEGFVRDLQEKAAVKIVPGHTHFFLCQTTHGSATDLQRWLLETFGLLIRDASNFRGLDAGHFRLATLAPDKNLLMVNALKEWRGKR